MSKRLAWHIEEPRVGQSYPNYYIAQLASKFVKVVFSELEEMNICWLPLEIL